MKKYTATFTCDRALWDEFKNWSRSCNSSASEQLSKFMNACLLQKVDDETHSYIDSVIDDRIEKFIDDRLNSLIDQHYIYKLEDIDTVIARLQALKNTEDTDKKSIAEETDRLIEPESDETDGDTEDKCYTEDRTRVTSFSGETARGGLHEILPNEDYDLKKYYTDREVAHAENLSQAAISRYRKNQRMPRDKTFFDRWKYDVKRKAWEKLNM